MSASPSTSLRRLSRTLVATAVLAGSTLFGGHAVAQDRMVLKVIGQPGAAGMIPKNKEKAFFDDFAKNTGLPIDADYKSIDTLGIKDTEQLRIMKAGLFDIVSLRVAQNSRDEPTLQGIDLVGLAPDYKVARKVYTAYAGTIEERLEKQFQIKLLGLWPFGPQIFFCKKPVTKLADIKGLKVRVSDANLAKFIESIGGTPVPLSFSETHQALSMGVVDCAVTSPSSANSASWPEVTTHQYPLGVQMAYNGYAVSMKVWNKLTPEQQGKMKTAFTKLTDDIWTYSEELYADSMNCNMGKDPCVNGKKFNLVTSTVTAADLDVVQKAVAATSVPGWSEICDKAVPGCSATWKKQVGPLIGMK